jgi:type I restriction enzyme S subunit
MEDIKRVQLSEIVELITKGTTPTTLGYEFQDEGVNFLKIECFDENGGFIESKVAHISEECHKKMKRSQLKNGDILFSIAGAIGRVAIVTEEMLPANINQALAIIRISDGQVYLPYIKLILTSPIVIEQFERKKQGVAQLNLSLKDINEISIPLPSKDKQIEFAELFDKVVGVISKRNKELSALDDLIKARFVEMFGDPYVNPLKWKKLKIKDAVTIEPQNGLYKPQSDYVTDGSGIPILRIDGFYDGMVTDFASLKRLKCSETERQRYLLLEDDIVINRVNSIEYLGKCAHIKDLLEDTVYESNMMRMHFDPEYYNPVYICKLLCSQFIYDQIVNHAKKSVNQASINQKDVLDFNIYQPPLDLQNEFANFVQQVDKSKVAVQKALDETQMLFDSLMQKYFM